MEFKLKTPDVQKPGHMVYQIQFSMETVNEQFRENVLGMILAALDGGTVQAPNPEQKPSALGFHKEDEDDEDA